MTSYISTQPVRQLEKRKGGYFYIKIDASLVNQFNRKRSTRLLCTLEKQITYPCGLNHYGDGHYFIIIAKRYIQALNLPHGDPLSFEINEDPNPLGVEIPELLEVLFLQDAHAKHIFDRITDGKKRSLIHGINRLKNVDKQIEFALAFLDNSKKATRKKG